MEILSVSHPLIDHKLTLLRNKKTPPLIFRSLIEEIVSLLAYEAMQDVNTKSVRVRTPIGIANGAQLTKPSAVIVPILRAGLSMLEGISKLIPTAEIGFLGMKRDEKTLVANTYANSLPADLSNRKCILLDPMLATGGTLTAAIEFLLKKGARDITVICILASPEGINKLKKTFTKNNLKIRLIIAALDKKLNHKGYIAPGLGDAGDRLYGVV